MTIPLVFRFYSCLRVEFLRVMRGESEVEHLQGRATKSWGYNELNFIFAYPKRSRTALDNSGAKVNHVS